MDYGLVHIAQLYVKDKGAILRLLHDHGVLVDGATPHKEVIAALKEKLETDPEFGQSMESVLREHGIIEAYENAEDSDSGTSDSGENSGGGIGFSGVMGIISGIVQGVGGAVAGVERRKAAEIEAKAQSDAFFQQYIMEQQHKNNVGKVVLISVISLVAIGITVYLVLRNERKIEG